MTTLFPPPLANLTESTNPVVAFPLIPIATLVASVPDPFNPIQKFPEGEASVAPKRRLPMDNELPTTSVPVAEVIEDAVMFPVVTMIEDVLMVDAVWRELTISVEKALLKGALLLILDSIKVERVRNDVAILVVAMVEP